MKFLSKAALLALAVLQLPGVVEPRAIPNDLARRELSASNPNPFKFAAPLEIRGGGKSNTPGKPKPKNTDPNEPTGGNNTPDKPESNNPTGDAPLPRQDVMANTIKNPPKTNKKYDTPESRGYTVTDRVNRAPPVDSDSVANFKKAGIDVGSSSEPGDWQQVNIQAGGETMGEFYTSVSQKIFLIANKDKDDDGLPADQQLPMKALQQFAMVKGFGTDFDLSTLAKIVESDITSKDGGPLVDKYTDNGDAEQPVSYAKGSAAFNDFANSNNGRAEFGQLTDNYATMKLEPTSIQLINTDGEDKHAIWNLGA